MAKWIMADNSIEIEQELEKVPVSILRIMKRRGVSEEDFEDFLSEKPKHTYDPFLLPDLKDACIEILHACNEGKRICVYGDYDADGVTSTTLMVSLLKRFSNNVRYFIPSRFNDGYGPNKNAFDSIAADGVDVIITVDCGITSRDEIEYAKSLGIKCIVTDHHILRDGMTPDCLVINPHRSDSSYPFKDLSGCGVAFKFAQGIERLLSEDPSLAKGSFTKSDLNDLLDLVAISTVADIVPLLDENRNLVKYGLNRINQTKRAGLIALIKALDLSGEINASSISYVIAPNINALGRMGAADNGVELLESNKKYSELEKLAFDVAETNRQRKSVQEKRQIFVSRCFLRMIAENLLL